jgi:hypothetical protein
MEATTFAGDAVIATFINKRFKSEVFVYNKCFTPPKRRHVVGFYSNGDQIVGAANMSARVGSVSDNHLGGWYTYR